MSHYLKSDKRGESFISDLISLVEGSFEHSRDYFRNNTGSEVEPFGYIQTMLAGCCTPLVFFNNVFVLSSFYIYLRSKYENAFENPEVVEREVEFVDIYLGKGIVETRMVEKAEKGVENKV